MVSTAPGAKHLKSGSALLAGALFFLLQGCTYAISPGITGQADRSISFADLDARPSMYVGRLVILGGLIDSISNTAQSTILHVSQRRLDRWGKPLSHLSSEGSFVVISSAPLDLPLSLQGRAITVAAVVEGTAHPALDDKSNTAPVLLSRELKLWPRERPSWKRPHYLDPLYDPHTSPRQF